MSTVTLSPSFKAASELFLNKLRMYPDTKVKVISEEKCMICTKTLCDVDGCHRHGHEEAAFEECGHVIGIECAQICFSEHQTCPVCRAEMWEFSGPKWVKDFWW